MVTVEIVRLPSEIASMLMVRNREVLPLCWQTQPNRRGKNALDELSDARLFSDVPLIDETMIAAVRGLLYLWNGWPDDAKRHVQSAPLNEWRYVTALCERMLGRWETARELFKKIPDQPFLAPLLKCAREILQTNSHQTIEKMLLESDESGGWDHLSFASLFNEAAMGRLGLVGEQAVSQIQLREFELLFNHCYEEATGLRVLVETRAPSSASTGKVRKREPARKPAASRSGRGGVVGGGTAARPRPTDGSRGKSEAPAQQQTSNGPTFRVTCPSCGAMIELPSSVRGNKGKCTRCGSLFAVGGKPAGGPIASGPSPVLIACPICQTMHKLPPAARGTNQRCGGCGSVFSVAVK
ncbi:MAG: hypothetical protein GX616_08190 [Planctomycetes bacterium]|nr:hypothetical protein [Planctomycetota bacterium]